MKRASGGSDNTVMKLTVAEFLRPLGEMFLLMLLVSMLVLGLMGLVALTDVSGHGGVHEDIEVTNNSMKPVKFQLEIGIRSDFADLFEVKSNRIVRRGRITTEWSQARQRLRATYRNGDFSRAVALSTARSSSKAAYANGRLSFEIELGPGARWHTCLPIHFGRRRRAFDSAAPLR